MLYNAVTRVERRHSPAIDAVYEEETSMTLGVDLEPFIILPSVLFSIIILVIIDKIGTVRGTVEDDEEEI